MIGQLENSLTLDEEKYLAQHKYAVEEYKRVSNQAVVWSEEIGRKIDDLVPDRP